MRKILLYLLLCFSCHGQIGTSIIINELFPKATTTIPEWLELHNATSTAINLRNWYYGHAGDSLVMFQNDMFIAAGGFLVITKDSTLFASRFPATRGYRQLMRWQALDNYHDTLFLWNNTGNVVDKAGWDYRWFDGWTDQALTRISFVNGLEKTSWSMAQKLSPGQPNSEVLWHKVNVASLDIGPIPFTPNNDGKDDFLAITILIPAGATAVVSLYGFDGRKYYEIPSVSSPRILWNGKMVSGQDVPCGPIFVVADVNNNGKHTVIRKKGVLWR